jgi:hypothetical protein
MGLNAVGWERGGTQAWAEAHGRKTPERAMALKAIAVVRKGKLTRTFHGWLDVTAAEKGERERGFREDFLLRDYDEKQRRKREFKATRTYHKKILARVRRPGAFGKGESVTVRDTCWATQREPVRETQWPTCLAPPLASSLRSRLQL